MLPIAPTTSHDPNVSVALSAEEWTEVLNYLTITIGDLRHMASRPNRTPDFSVRITTLADRCAQLRDKIDHASGK